MDIIRNRTHHHAPLVAATVVALAGVADAVTTWIGLHDGAHEANAAAASTFSTIGLVPALTLRVVIPAVLAFVLLRWTRRVDAVIYGAAMGSVVFVACAWSLVALSNHCHWV